MCPTSARELGNSYDKNGSTYPSSLRPQHAIYMRENNMSKSDTSSQSRLVTQNTQNCMNAAILSGHVLKVKADSFTTYHSKIY